MPTYYKSNVKIQTPEHIYYEGDLIPADALSEKDIKGFRDKGFLREHKPTKEELEADKNRVPGQTESIRMAITEQDIRHDPAKVPGSERAQSPKVQEQERAKDEGKDRRAQEDKARQEQAEKDRKAQVDSGRVPESNPSKVTPAAAGPMPPPAKLIPPGK